MNSELLKQQIKEYWDTTPCGTNGVDYAEGTLEYYEALLKNRQRKEYFLKGFADFEKWKGKELLEVGCGVGSDLVEFAKNGVIVTGIDLSPKSVELSKKRLEVYGLKGMVFEADAERLPFKDNNFDVVYNFGVLHHTPDIEKAISEIYRVLKKGGEIRIMLYHKPSLVCLQMWLIYGLLKGKLFADINDLFYYHHESVGTKVYTIQEVKELFYRFDIEVKAQVAIYDIRYARGRYLPLWIRHFVPSCLGWNILVKGRK